MKENTNKKKFKKAPPKKKKNYIPFIIASILFLAVAVGLGIHIYKEREAEREKEIAQSRTTELVTTASTVATTEASEATTEKKKQNVIDFDKLKKQNKDIVAWIKVPGTSVDYPVYQHPKDNSYYLTHNADKQEDSYGAIYIETFNNKYFTDPNTVVYGHNMRNGSMFGSLHKFEDAKFFNKHRKIIIYTEDDTLTYKIFAAFVHSNMHILYEYDFTDYEDFDRYLGDLYSNTDSDAHIDRKVDVDSDDRIITLSTCNHGISTQRYLIQGVLLDDDDDDEEEEDENYESVFEEYDQ